MVLVTVCLTRPSEQDGAVPFGLGIHGDNLILLTSVHVQHKLHLVIGGNVNLNSFLNAPLLPGLFIDRLSQGDERFILVLIIVDRNPFLDISGL